MGVAGTRGRGVGCHGFLTIATDKRLQSIKEFPHISWIIEAPERNSNAANAGYHRDPARVPRPIFIHPHLQLFHRWGKLCFISLFSRLHSSILCPCLVPALCFSSLFWKARLCVTPFLVPLCYAVHIVTQEVKTELVAVCLVLVKRFHTAATNLNSSTVRFHLGPVRQQGHQCLCTAGILIFLLINAKGGQAQRLSKLQWLSLSWQGQKPPLGAKNSPI